MSSDSLRFDVDKRHEPLGVIGNQDALILRIVRFLIGAELPAGWDRLDECGRAGTWRRVQHLDGAVAIANPDEACPVSEHPIRTRTGIAARGAARGGDRTDEDTLA